MEAGPSPQGPEASIVCRKKTLELIFCIYFFPNKVMLAASHVGRAGSQRRPRPAEPTLPREAAGRPRLGLAFKVHCAEWQRLPRPAQASQHGQGPPAREPSPDGASWSLQHRCTARPPGVPGPALQAPPPPQLPHCQQRVGSTPCTTLLRRSVCPSVCLSARAERTRLLCRSRSHSAPAWARFSALSLIARTKEATFYVLRIGKNRRYDLISLTSPGWVEHSSERSLSILHPNSGTYIF